VGECCELLHNIILQEGGEDWLIWYLVYRKRICHLLSNVDENVRSNAIEIISIKDNSICYEAWTQETQE